MTKSGFIWIWLRGMLIGCACLLIGVVCGLALIQSDILRQTLSRIAGSSVSSDFVYLISAVASLVVAGGLMVLAYYFVPKKRVEK